VSAEPELDADRGRLRLAEPTLQALIAHAADPVAAVLEDDALPELARLRAAGVIRGGESHPALAGALAAIVRPSLCTLQLSYDGRSMQGWASYEDAALLLPAREGADERRTLLAVHPTLLPGALARLVGLAPRPRPEAATPVSYVEGTLDGVIRRWRLEAAWTLASGTAGGATLEMIDTEGGIWLLQPTDEGAPMAWPVTPTFAWRQLVRLVMRRDAATAAA